MAQRKVNCEVYTDRGIVGKEGADGKSAYQQAVSGGYQGTEEEFEQALASDIATVANNVTNINVVGNNIENVNTAVDNMSAIIAAPTAATQAAASASQAATSATNAQTSETNAATSASNAEASATNASASATISTTKASEATSSATSASASATSANEASTSASTSATNAQTWAEGADSAVTPLGGKHSAKGWASIAKQYAESIGSALKYKGSVSTYSTLPSTGQEIGDTWNVLDTGDNYAWTGTEWDKLSGTVDLSAYRTSADQDIIDSKKQDTITDLATIRSGASAGATAVQPGDLATVATSGSYTDLTNKPTIPTVDSALSSTSTNAIQNKVVNTALAGKANVAHTHTSGDIIGLATVATSGSYADLTNKPTIPTVDSALSSTSTNAIQNKVVNTALAGKANAIHTHASDDITGLATVATSGMYSDLTGTPGVATADTLGLVKPDGTTITVTADGVISATGGSGSGSGFDFEGTKAEFDAAVAAGTITADSVSLITDDVDGANVATKAELQAVDRSKADTALSNLSNVGRENIKQSLSNYALRFPDYGSVVTIKSGATTSKQRYIAPQDGWISYTLFERTDTTNIVASVDTPGKGAVVWVNGNRISEVANWDAYVHYTTSYLFHPVKEGDIIDYYIQAQGYLYFYPMLGAN